MHATKYIYILCTYVNSKLNNRLTCIIYDVIDATCKMWLTHKDVCIQLLYNYYYVCSSSVVSLTSSVHVLSTDPAPSSAVHSRASASYSLQTELSSGRILHPSCVLACPSSSSSPCTPCQQTCSQSLSGDTPP